MCSRIGTIVKHQHGKCTARKLTCRSWSCPDCAKWRRKRLVAEALSGKPNRFITLTVNPAWFDGPIERAEKLVLAWRWFVKKWRRHHPGQTGEFLAVFEATKRGEPHLHIVWRGGWVKQNDLREHFLKHMGAPVQDVRYIKGGQQVAEYVTKYISKRNIKFGSLKRYWRSTRYLKESNAARRRRLNVGARFFVLDMSLGAYVAFLDEKGHDLRPTKSGAFEFDYPPWLPAPPCCLLAE